MINYLSGEDDNDEDDRIIDAYDWTVRLTETLSFEFDRASSKCSCGIVGCLGGVQEDEEGRQCCPWLHSKKYVSSYSDFLYL